MVVTENEEKLSQKETELRQISDRYDKLRQDHDELQRQHAQITDEKTLLAEQLRAETEMSAEAEEVGCLLFSRPSAGGDQQNMFLPRSQVEKPLIRRGRNEWATSYGK